ncbi:MAG: aromatic ring-hydroxylating dioxygenase subunit alpha [Chloroflexota bacterium]
MLSQEANDRLTRVGPGTPMGELLRRYWYPVATVPELDAEPVMSVKLLGENLALYRNDQGDLGLVSERCPHRGASLAYGIPEEDGLRCAYHGWKFAPTGRCIEQPAEPGDSTFKHRVQIPAYPVQEMGGLIWAYLGPEPVPLLPRYDLFVRDDLQRQIGTTRLPCNWLQIMENSMDPVHLEYLHGMLTNYTLKRQGKPPAAKIKHHEKIRFQVFDYGISKQRLLEGDPEDSDDWQVGHPILFPNILAVGDHRVPEFQIRVPMDDTNTYVVWYWTRPLDDGAAVQSPHDIQVAENPYRHDNGRLVVETINGQDMMAWVTQGPISDRTTERLGTSDQGIILYRTMLEESMRKVERGEDPMAVIRDPARNTPMIEIPRERVGFFTVGNFIDSAGDAVPAFQRGL